MATIQPPQVLKDLKRVSETLRWRITVTEPTQRAATLQTVFEPGVLETLLRQAIAETWLVDIRRKWIQGLPGATNMDRGNETQRHNPRATPRIPRSLRAEFQEASGAVDDAVLSEHRARNTLTGKALARHVAAANVAKREAERRLQRLRSRIRKAALPHNRTPAEARLPKVGTYRTAALELLQQIADLNAVQVTTKDGVIRAGIGNRAQLDTVLTPSSTELLTEHPTTSDRQILWRQLEFGTGIYADPKGPGVWWYGKDRGHGLLLRGTKGVHALFDPARRLPYTAAAMQFKARFFALLAEALNGG